MKSEAKAKTKSKTESKIRVIDLREKIDLRKEEPPVLNWRRPSVTIRMPINGTVGLANLLRHLAGFSLLLNLAEE